MADEPTQLQALPEPGVAIFPQNQSTSQIDLIMQSNSTYTTVDITFADGRPFLKVKSPFVTMSSRKHIIDATTGEKLCDLRSKPFGRSKRYYAQAPNSSTPLLEIKNSDLSSGFLANGGKYQTTVTFTNAATGDPEEVYLRGDSFRNEQNAVVCRGVCCGIIDEKFKYSKRQYLLSVAPGLDPFLVAVLAVNLDEKENEDQSARAGRVANCQGIAGAAYSGSS